MRVVSDNERTRKQDVEDIISKLNGKQFRPSQRFPSLVIGENKKALYVKNYSIDKSGGKEYYDIDLIEFPSSALEKAVENALASEYVEAVIFTKGERYVHKEEWDPVTYHYSGRPPESYSVDVELSLRIVKGEPQLRINFSKAI